MKKILWFFGLIPSIGFAQFQKDSMRNIELSPVTLNSVVLIQKKEYSLQKLPTAFLKRNNQGQDLPFLLNSLAGVTVSSDAGTGTGYTDIKVRGTDLTRINVTMNGVPVNDPESQATYFVNTPDLLSSANQVTLTKGVGQSMNGSSNFGASLSIQNLDIQQLKPMFSYQVDAGSFNTLKQTLKASTGLLHDKFTATLRLSSIVSDGYIDRSASQLESGQISASYRIDSHQKVVFNYVKGNQTTGQAWNGVIQDSLKTNPTYNELGLMSNGKFYKNQTDNYGQDYFQLFYDNHINKHWNMGTTLFYTKGKGFYEEFKIRQRFSDYGLPDLGTIMYTDLVRRLWLNNDFYGGRVYANYLSNKLDAGLYINYNEYKGQHFGDIIWSEHYIPKGQRWYDLNAFKKDFNVYGMAEYKISNQWKMLADLQTRWVNYQLNGFRNNPNIKHDLRYLFVNPKIKLHYQRNSLGITLSSGIAQKEPNRDDIETGTQSLPKPEKLWDNELQVSYMRFRNIGLFATLYHMQYRDQLVLTGKINDVGAFTRTNVADSYRRGIELEAQYKPNNAWLEISLNVAFSKNRIKSFTEYISDYDKGIQVSQTYAETPIALSPEIVAGGLIQIKPLFYTHRKWLKEINIDLLPKYVGKQYLDNTGSQSKRISAYSVTDAVLNFPFTLSKSAKLNARIGCYNILDMDYQAKGYTYSFISFSQLSTFNYYFPQAGRRWMVGMGITL